MSKADEHFFQVNKQDKDYTSDEKGDMSFFQAKHDYLQMSTFQLLRWAPTAILMDSVRKSS